MIENDPQPQRVIASVHGLLSNVGLTWEQLQTYISSILGRLQQRAVDMDVDYQSSAMGFLFDENLLNDLVRLIADRCYATGTYYHIDRESGALDFLTSEEITANGCDISCTRYTPNGVNELRALLHIVDDEVQGDAELEQTMRTYFDTMGYPLQSGVRLTSLEGRAIQNGESLIVEVGDQPIDGLYEGFIGLGHSHFPFLYDPVKHTVLLAEPMETRSVLFRVKNSWVSRRKGMEDIDTKIPYEAMQGVADIGEKIDATVAARKQTVLGDSLFSLEGKLSPELSPALAKIIEGRLIRNGDGLVE